MMLPADSDANRNSLSNPGFGFIIAERSSVFQEKSSGEPSVSSAKNTGSGISDPFFGKWLYNGFHP
jgi:hypothetical protein